MNTPWKIVFGYQLGSKTNAQAVYDELFKAALTYKYGHLVVPIGGKELTDAIFSLTNHDRIIIGDIAENNKEITGQQLKELFITTLFLKRLEEKFHEKDMFFIVVPETESSCDTAIMVVESHVKPKILNPRQLKLPEEHIPFLFQIKEYLDYQRLQNLDLIIPERVDVGKLKKIAGVYSENLLIFMRDFSHYDSEDAKDFFRDHQNCYIISSTDDIKIIPEDSTKQEYEPILLDKSKHNYVITYPAQTFSIVNFEWPKFLRKM